MFEGKGVSVALIRIVTLAFFIPPEFSIVAFGLVLQPYRIVLLALIVPAVSKLLRDRAFRAYDVAPLLFALPVFASMMYNQGAGEGFVAGGLTTLEVTGSYLIARAYLNSWPAFRLFMETWIIAALVFLPLVVAESVSHHYIVRGIAAQLTGHTGAVSSYFQTTASNTRFGLLRAEGPFGHPILCGLAYAIFFPYVILIHRGARRIAFSLASLLGVVASVSSDALIVLLIACAVSVALYRSSTRPWRAPLRSLAFVVVPVYAILELLSTRPLFTVILTTLAFNSWTGYYRTLIWRYGMDNVLSHPILGIGYSTWSRPSWMISSVDAYWLLIAMRHGVFAFLLLAGCCVFVFFRMLSAYGRFAWRSQSTRIVGAIWLAMFLGLLVSGLSVDYWGSMAMIVPLMLGTGVNILTAQEKSRSASRHVAYHRTADEFPAGAIAAPAPSIPA